MADIFRVSDPQRPGELFALKRVRADWDDVDDFRRMLLDEAAILQSLEHPKIARVFEVIEDDGRTGLVMELVEGLDLERIQRHRQRRKMGPWPLEPAIYVAHQALEGLDFAHDARDSDGRYLHVVHRDVSPGNVMVQHDGTIKLVDFGIAKARGRLSETQVGQVKGKFRYMAPEQIKGEAPEPATDVYAVAVVLWEMFVGERIYDKDGAAQLMMKVANAQVPDLRTLRPGLPDEVYSVMDRATQLHPKDRFPSAKAFQEALDAALFEFDAEACRRELQSLIREARADESRLSLERAVARAKGVADGLEDAILAALQLPDRVESSPSSEPGFREAEGPISVPPMIESTHAPTPTRPRAVPLVQTPPKVRDRIPPPSVLNSETGTAEELAAEIEGVGGLTAMPTDSEEATSPGAQVYKEN